jgi:MFS family permease
MILPLMISGRQGWQKAQGLSSLSAPALSPALACLRRIAQSLAEPETSARRPFLVREPPKGPRSTNRTDKARMQAQPRLSVLHEPAYRRFLTGYGLSYVFYWITLLSIGWWMWETTGSATWVGIAYFCDLFPSIIVTPIAAALADRGDRLRILKTVLWLQVTTGLGLAAVAASGALTPPVLAGFALAEGTLVGFGQPAFFGLLNRLVSPQNLSAAVGLNVSVVQTSYVLGPLLAGLLFSFGMGIAPLAFAANAVGTLGYLWCLGGITLRPPPDREEAGNAPALLPEVLAGLSVFWTNPVVYRATVFSLGVAVLQRPLTSLMAPINDRFALFSPAYFTLLTASFMAGGLVAGLIHARRNSDVGQDRAVTLAMVAVVVLYALLFPVLGALPGARVVALAGLFLLGLGTGYVMTGVSIILQNRTPEHMRSRVLGNNLMLFRAAGAGAVLGVGLLVDAHGFAVAMPAAALCVAVGAPLALLRMAGHRS